jgi:hypothetical protein
MATTWKVRDRVQVSLPYGQQGETTQHLATIDRIAESGKIHVRFDDPYIYGGYGHAWVEKAALAEVPK